MRPLSEPTPQLTPKAPKVHQKTILRQHKIASSTAPLKQSKNFPWRIVFRIIFLAFLTALVVWIFNSPLFLVKNIQVEGNKVVETATIKNQAPTRVNIWLYPVKKTENSIRKSSALISDVAIYRVLPNTIKISVAERVLAIEWQSNNQSYLVGLDGKVVMTQTPPYAIPKVVDTTNIAYSDGQLIAVPSFIDFLLTASNQFNAVTNLELDHFEVGATTFDVTAVPKSGPKIILDSTRDPAVELKAAKIVLDAKKDLIKEYLDVRVTGKAFIK